MPPLTAELQVYSFIMHSIYIYIQFRERSMRYRQKCMQHRDMELRQG